MVINDRDLGLVAVEYPKYQAGPFDGALKMSQRRRYCSSRVAAIFEFRTNKAYPHFCEEADDGRATVTNIVTSPEGEIYAYVYSKPFADQISRRRYPAGRYLVRLVTVDCPIADDEGVVTIRYEAEPIRQMGSLVGSPDHRERAFLRGSEAIGTQVRESPLRYIG